LRDEPTLSRRQEKALAALLTHGTVRAAAEAAGLSDATLFRYLADAHFKREYRARRAEAVECAVGALQTACVGAVSTLIQAMKGPTVQTATKVTAAKITLDFSLRGVELQDLQERVEDLEHAARKRK
jgi:hypothetical protein